MLRWGVERFWVKAEKWSLFLVMLLIPTQLGKHFWPNWSLVKGIRIDYLSPTLYLIDIGWIILFLGWLRRTNIRGLIKKVLNFENLVWFLFIVINILVAVNKPTAVYRWLRLGQWWWMFKYVWNNRKSVNQFLKLVIPVWIVTESILGLSQVIKGGSLQGFWWWLGERRFDFTTIGIAQISVWGEGLVRAYGTFSHPNSLAGFILISLSWWVNKYSPTDDKIRPQKNTLKKIWWWVVVWCGVLAIVLSGSRTVWLLTLILLVLIYTKFFKEKDSLKTKWGYLIVIVGVMILTASIVNVNYRISDFVGGWDIDGWNKRMELNLAAIRMWKSNLMVGVGAGNFIPNLDKYNSGGYFNWLQPVHNVFLLIGSEIGVLGLLAVSWKLIVNLKRKRNNNNWWWLGLVIISGMTDHYWLTLPQNTWLLAIMLGIL